MNKIDDEKYIDMFCTFFNVEYFNELPEILAELNIILRELSIYTQTNMRCIYISYNNSFIQTKDIDLIKTYINNYMKKQDNETRLVDIDDRDNLAKIQFNIDLGKL